MPPDFRSSNVPLFWRRAEQGRPGTFCSEGRGISDNSMKPELPSVLFDQNWLTPCQTVYNIVAHIVNPVSYLNVLLCSSLKTLFWNSPLTSLLRQKLLIDRRKKGGLKWHFFGKIYFNAKVQTNESEKGTFSNFSCMILNPNNFFQFKLHQVLG